jgi:hypothetical protein
MTPAWSRYEKKFTALSLSTVPVVLINVMFATAVASALMASRFKKGISFFDISGACEKSQNDYGDSGQRPDVSLAVEPSVVVLSVFN